MTNFGVVAGQYNFINIIRFSTLAYLNKAVTSSMAKAHIL